ncbi:DNA polymerase III, subunit gamma and tau [Peptostreptococcaceae bacterium oral taxon 113 str. W5053]|nr:DNA polymerase III, subunit gamma and tau [Peptostreptococcaceae bacterium oral taxon 113 str. W5053]
MHQALYRVYRPKTFDEIVGQTQVTEVLKNQIIQGTPAHAYLFSGTRGTGKTSCAKVLSRAVNCLHPVNGNPCNACANCKEALQETTLDIVEMDAASNRRIDDIRELREQVLYLPAQLKYKVYIIDEAHMITNEGFNALLKTLEEPPAHLIFILATTEAERIPSTILSRCQRFEFSRIDEEIISDHLEKIVQKTEIPFEKEALDSIAKKSGGAMRDALSAMEQVIGLGAINMDTLSGVFGKVKKQELFQLIHALCEKDGVKALSIFHDVSSAGKNLSNLLKDLIEHFRLLMVLKATGQSFPAELNAEEMEFFLKQSKEISMDSIFEVLDILLEGEERLRWSEAQETVVEMSLLKILYGSSEKSLQERIAALEEKASLTWFSKNDRENNVLKSQEDKAVSTTIQRDEERKETVELSKEISERDILEKEKSISSKIEISAEVQQSKEEVVEISPEEFNFGDAPLTEEEKGASKDIHLEQIWNKLMEGLKKEDPSNGALLMFGELDRMEDRNLVIRFEGENAFQKDYLTAKERKEALEALSSKILGKAIHFVFEEKPGIRAKEEKLRKFFGDLLEIK